MPTILHGATVISMDPERHIYNDGSLVIEGSRIAWVGKKCNLPSFEKDVSIIPLDGHIILPGFINLHTHAALSVLRGIGDDLGVAPAYSPNVPQGVYLSREDCYALSLLGGLEALKFGTTCIVDNYIYENEAAKAFDLLGMRAVVSERLHDANLFKIPNNQYEFDATRGDELLQRNLELIEKWEGASGGRIHTRLGPHAPDTCSTEYLKRIRTMADFVGKDLVIHLAQSRREVAQIGARSNNHVVGYLDNLGLLGPRMIAGHCIYLSEDEKRLLVKTGTNISHQSGSNAKGGMMAPIQDLVQLGAIIGLGTDNMSGDMIEVMRLAVCTARMRAEDNQAMRAINVLEMATMGGARALGMQSEIGSLEVGKKADLVIVDYRKTHLTPLIDPIANLVFNGLGSDIDMVYVDGDLVISGGKSTKIEEIRVLAEAQARTEALWEKVSTIR